MTEKPWARIFVLGKKKGVGYNKRMALFSMVKKKKFMISSREKGWKRTQKSNHSRKLFYSAGFFVLSAAIIFLSYQFFQLKNFLEKPLSSAPGSVSRQYFWDKKSPINILFLGLDDKDSNQPQVISVYVGQFDPQKKSLKVLSAPTDLLIKPAAMLDEYRLDQLYWLGGVQNPPQNMIIVQDSLSYFLGIPLDGYVVTDKEGYASISLTLGIADGDGVGAWITSFLGEVGRLGFLLKVQSFKHALGQNVWTSLTPWELFWIMGAAKDVPEENIQAASFSADTIKNGHVADEIQFDEFMQRYFSEPAIKQERLKVKVLNGTSKEGLAKKAARFITTIGGEVIEIDNAQSEVQKTMMVSFTRDAAYTKTRLIQVFACQNEDRDNSGGERADILLTIGWDFWLRFEGR